MRLRREQDGTTAIGLRTLDVPVLSGDRDGLQGTSPVTFPALQVEQPIDRPGELGIERHGALGEVPRRFFLGFALRLEEQAAQAELLGVGRGEHGLENAPSGRAVAGELGSLRAQ